MPRSSSGVEKVLIGTAIAPILALIPDERLRRLYSENFANMCGVELKLVEQSVKRANSGKPAVSLAPRPFGPAGRSSAVAPNVADALEAQRGIKVDSPPVRRAHVQPGIQAAVSMALHETRHSGIFDAAPYQRSGKGAAK